MEPGKLFVGGISWDTNEDRLKEYFQTFGEVVEAVIMKDRATGRARGFGFIIYADPSVAELVVRQKHMIDGRAVEAKKAVPRDDQHIQNKNHNSPIASPAPARTKKIFVGGLASTVTEGDFKRYFDQFGTITDVVVMYDHNTQRPRGFGFITYDSEEAVERALVRTFHELNGKVVEVKRAVPKELSSGPSRSPFGGGSSGLISRVNSLLNGYPQGYNSSPVERHTPISYARSGFPSFSPSTYGTTLNYEPRMSPSYNETANLFPNINFEQGLNALHSSNVTRHGSFSEYEGVNRSTGPNLGSSSWSLWGNGSISDTTFTGNSASMNSEAIWNPSPISVQAGPRAPLSFGLGFSYGRDDVNLGSAVGFYGRDLRTRTPPTSSFALDGGYDVKLDDFYSGGGELGLKGSGSLEFGVGNAVSDVPLNNPAGLCW